MHVHEVRVLIDVADLESETAFWTTQLGCTVIRAFEGGVMLRVGMTTVEFFAANTGPESASNTRFSWRIDNLDVHWQRWAGTDNVGFELRANPWGDRSFSLVTPNRVEVILFEPNP